MAVAVMHTLSPSERYSRTAVALHWIIALFIFAMIALGYYMTGIPRGTPERAFFFNLHKSLGLLAAALILLRLAWRASHPAPSLPQRMPAWQVRVARWSHGLLYACMLLQPLTGYISSSFNKYGIKFFGIGLPNWGWEDKQLRELFTSFHHAIAVALIVLISVHILAALKHRFIDRDRVFQRMLPWR
jgi:cytochrome b561